MPRTRVFVSSVIEGFAEYRQAARSGIERGSRTKVSLFCHYSPVKLREIG